MQKSFPHSILRKLWFLSLPLLFQLQVFPASDRRAEIDSLGFVDSPSADSSDAPSSAFGASREASIPQGALLRVRPNALPSLSRLRSGSLVSGTLLRSLYCQDREIVPVGSQIELIVETIEKNPPTRKRAREFAARLWNPLSQGEAAYSVVFRSAALKLPDGRTAAMNVSFGRLLRLAKIQAKPSKETAVPQDADKQSGTLILRLESALNLPQFPEAEGLAAAQSHIALSENSAARLCLLSPLSATRNREGERFQARLVEPLQFDANLIPEGSLFEGRITRRRAPRRLRRPGSLFVSFERIVTPSGQPILIHSSLISVESDRRARITLDSEGMVRGRAPGVAALAMDLGMSYLSGKIVDDLIEEGVKAAMAGITSEKAASIGRYFGIGAGLFFFLVRRGRDASLEQYSELEVILKPRLEQLVH
jgi:hypothetical protein